MRKALLASMLLIGATAVALATPPNFKVNSDGTSEMQNDQRIWIDPNNAESVVALWRDFRLGYRRVAVGVSPDGGKSWSDSLFTAYPFPRHSLPCLTADRFGNLYACFLNYGFNVGVGDSSMVVLYRSANQGSSWTGIAHTPTGEYVEDKLFTTVDRTGGEHDGNFYVSWTRFLLEPEPDSIMFARSTDDGHSFDEPVAVGPPLYTGINCENDFLDAGHFSIPIVDADGDVHVFWMSVIVLPGCYGYPTIKHVASSDGGLTFSDPESVFYTTVEWDWVDGSVNIYGMPNGDCDVSGGPYDNTIYISQCQRAQGWVGETDVIVRKSTDKGQTWSDAQVVNDDPPGQDKDQFHPWLVVNEDGVVLLIFYDQRLDDEHTKFDVYFSASFDGGETYIKNMRVSDVSIDPALILAPEFVAPEKETGSEDGRVPLSERIGFNPRAGLFGEYIGMQANHDTVSAIWTDTRDGNEDCYSARFLIPLQPPRLYWPEDDGIAVSDSVEFRWATCWHEEEDQYRLEVSRTEDFNTVDYIAESLFDNSVVVSEGLTPDTLYYWRVKAFRSSGDSTEYSDPWEFHLGDTALPSVDSTYPLAEETSALGDTEIRVSFNVDMDASSITAGSFHVHGQMSGRHSGTIGYESSTKTMRFTPEGRFFPGDIITVILTEGVLSADGLALTGGFCWSFRVAASAAPAQFPSRRQFNPGLGPRDVRPADFDGDGDLDLAVANLAWKQVCILWNAGDGLFYDKTDYPVETWPYSIATGDYNEDGATDLAVVNNKDVSTSVLLNNQDSTFAIQTLTGPVYWPSFIRAFDFDNDGDLDLAVPGWYIYAFYYVGLLINDGIGLFSLGNLFPVGDEPASLSPCDLDGDGVTDLAVVNYGSDNVTPLMNTGDGDFFLGPGYPGVRRGTWIETADLNGDHSPDIVSTEYGSDSVSVFLNDRHGLLEEPLGSAVGDAPFGLTLCDLDGDGDLDLVTANELTGDISILFNDGSAQFEPHDLIQLDPGLTSVAAADLDGDADLDLIVTGYDSNLYILINQPPFVCGDADANDIVNISDAVYLIAYIFGGGPLPQPLESGDVDCNWLVNISDAVYLIAYIFGGGPVPCEACPQ